jgi:hypothetical protein
MVDADDRIITPPTPEDLAAPVDALEVEWRADGMVWSHPWLIRSDTPARFEGRTHEHFDPSGLAVIPSSAAIAYGTVPRSVERERAGAMRDLALLEDDTTPRGVFYLAQTWHDLGACHQALRLYDQRASMGGWVDETFVAMLRAARIANSHGEPVVERFLATWELCPHRGEPFVELAEWYRQRRHWNVAFQFAAAADNLPVPRGLFVEAACHAGGWRARFELALAGYYVNGPEWATGVWRGLLDDPALPENVRVNVADNLDRFGVVV